MKEAENKQSVDCRNEKPTCELTGTECAYAQLQTARRSSPKTWLVTGAAGFIGSHLVAGPGRCRMSWW